MWRYVWLIGLMACTESPTEFEDNSCDPEIRRVERVGDDAIVTVHQTLGEVLKYCERKECTIIGGAVLSDSEAIQQCIG